MSIKLLRASASYIRSEYDEFDAKNKNLMHRAAWFVAMLVVGLHFYLLALITFPFRPVETLRTLHEFDGDKEAKEMADELEDRLKKI